MEANTNGERPTGYWWCSGTNANEAKVFKAHAAPLELCDNLINALKLLAIQQKDGDSPIHSIGTGLHERSRRGIMDGWEASSKRVTVVRWAWVICVRAQDRFMSKNRSLVRVARRWPSGKEQMS